MRPQDFIKKCIQPLNLNPVLVFTGCEEYWKSLHINLIKDKILGENGRYNFFKYDAAIDSVSKVINELNELGFFVQKKVIHYNSIDHLNVEDQKQIINYANNPNKESILILDAEKIDGRSPIKKSKPIMNHVVDYSIKKKSNDLSTFIDYKLKELGGLQIEPQLKSFLVNKFPSNLRLLANNIEKLAAHAGYSNVIRMSDVKVINIQEPETNHFSFVDALVDKNIKQVLKLKDVILEKKDNIYILIGLLRWQFQNLVRAKQMIDDNLSDDLIVKECRIPPFKRSFFLKIVSKYTQQELNIKYKLIANADFALKSTSLREKHIFEMLLFSLCK